VLTPSGNATTHDIPTFVTIERRDVIDALLEATKTVKNNSEKIFIEKKLTELSNKNNAAP